jgi:hemerythrin-like domain-containing protein
MSTDAIAILKEDHRQIRRLFGTFEEASEDADAARAEIVDNIVEALTVHTYLENEVMYPTVRTLVPELEQDILQSFEEHHVADVLCGELALMYPGDERLTAKTTVLIDAVTRHIQDEEQDWFPKVRAALGRKELQDIGARMIALRDHAPHRPERSLMRKMTEAVTSRSAQNRPQM